ncbi:MAG TPA: S8/S53 family peptidase [Actinomycetota bacterium]|nr:S8/S53 family peptidase [Actinomycetota bacterium]
MRRIALALLAAVTAALVPLAPGAAQTAGSPGVAIPTRGGDDAVVLAIIDFTFSPYHWDYLASKMPQHLDRDRSNDLPLGTAPHTWLNGFPAPGEAFASYKPIDLTLEEKDPNAQLQALDDKDKKKWDAVKRSTRDQINYYWLPDTKVIGAIEFGSQKIHGNSGEHGTGTTSVSVGNLHGTCPECLLVFIDIETADEAVAALDWAMDQPWIDAVSNSYGNGDTIPKVYNADDAEAQRKATERGQTIFFSAGNGFENSFTVPNPTYLSSEKGPDWLITVGAVSPTTQGSYVGAGKPADVSGVGRGYPSAYSALTVSETGRSGFGGTSNAAPTVAGMYLRALYQVRQDYAGPSRMQARGVIAAGHMECGAQRRKCELGDGSLTAQELRRRLLLGAVHTTTGMTDPEDLASLPAVAEDEYIAEGHGTYLARSSGKTGPWLKELGRILGPLYGRTAELERPPGEREWMIVDSFCRQEIWGQWKGGYYLGGETDLPGPDPAYPLRSALEQACPSVPTPP